MCPPWFLIIIQFLIEILEDDLIEPLDNVDPAVDNEDDTCQEDLGNINIASSENISRF